jgi:hypothetical protein
VVAVNGGVEMNSQEDSTFWTMPEWIEPYRHLISETGDQSVEELMNDWNAGFHDDYMRAARLMAVNAQIELLERLRSGNLLLPHAEFQYQKHEA